MKTLLTLATLLLLAAPAAASTVRVTAVTEYDDSDIYSRDDTDTTSAVARYRAAAGERNRVRITRGRPDVFVIRDSGARIKAGPGCRSRARHVVACRVRKNQDARFLSFRLGDHSDRLYAGPKLHIDLRVRGGEGNDRLHGGSGYDALEGGPGRDMISGNSGGDTIEGDAGADRLSGGGGRDTLIDGPGRDVVRGGVAPDTLASDDGGVPADDRLDGGGGPDLLSYRSRRGKVTATLGATGGVAGERDTLRSLESIEGGRGGDMLTGDDRANQLSGLGGADVLDGRGGADTLSTEGQGDALTCGTGADSVIGSYFDLFLLAPDCERIASGFSYEADTPANPVRTTADSVTFSLRCAYGPGQTVELRLPPVHTPWYPRGDLYTLLGTGERPTGSTSALCETTIPLNAAGRALTRPTPVLLLNGDYSRSGWHFLLR